MGVTAGAADRAPREPVVVLWRFARPHTIIGTALSVVGLYAIAAAERAAAPALGDLLATLIAGLTVNIAIVGVNQITDVEIDRINKPWLPIAAGDLSLRRRAGDRRRVHRDPARHGAHPGRVETVAVAAGLAVGALYSLPPFRLKRFPVAAVAVHHRRPQPRGQPRRLLALRGRRSTPPVWALCLFVLPFSFAIAVLKDVPDIEGDRRYSIRTFTVRLGPGAGVQHRPGRARDSPTRE